MNARSSVLWLQEVTKNREQILTRQNVIFNFTFVKLKANYYEESSEFIHLFFWYQWYEINLLTRKSNIQDC